MRVARASMFGVAAWIGTIAAPVSALASPPPAEPAPVESCPEVRRPPLHVPGDGKGAMTLGGILMIGGTTATAVNLGFLIDEGPGWGLTRMGMVLGIAGIGLGIGTTIVGFQRQRRFREWQSATRLQPPRQGYALLAAGVASFVGGGAIIGISLGYVHYPLPSWLPLGFGLGGVGVVASSFLLFTGGSIHAQFQRWRKSQAWVLPTASFGQQGMQLGLAGRF